MQSVGVVRPGRTTSTRSGPGSRRRSSCSAEGSPHQTAGRMEQRRRAKSQGCQGGGTLSTTATRGCSSDGWTDEGAGGGDEGAGGEDATAVAVVTSAGDDAAAAAAGRGVGVLSDEDAEAMDGARWRGRTVVAMTRLRP